MRKVKRGICIFLCDVLCCIGILATTYYYYYKTPKSGQGLGIVVENPFLENKSPSFRSNETSIVDSSSTDSSSAESSNTDASETDNGTTDWSNKFADKFTDTIVSTDTSYTSSDIAVTIEQKSFGSGNDTVTYYVADVYIASMDCFSTKFAQNTYGIGYTESLKSMSQSVNAVLAINGDSYSNDRHKDNGTIIRNGMIYRAQYSPYDICALYYDGTMKTYHADEFDLTQAVDKGVCQTWIFGPELLDQDGKAKTSFYTWDYIRQSHPRTAIGYYEPGHYCMVLVDGRQDGYSRGMYLSELAQVFEDLGCKAAYNLDGGHCSFMTLESKVVNQPYKPSKDISDCILITELSNY